MKRGRFEEIVHHANGISDIGVRIAYLEGIIDVDDRDGTDYNARLVTWKKSLQMNKEQSKKKEKA
jgi:hypothetical protein